MQVFPGYQSFHDSRETSVAIGVFDGVHLGHQALLEQAVAISKEHNLASVVYTFDPHPARILSPSLAPAMIEPLAARLDRLAAVGFDAAVVEPFSKAYASTPPRDFVDRVLRTALRARAVVIGEGFTFGRKQQGTVELLHELGSQGTPFTVHAVSCVRKEGIIVSSTKIREFVQAGNVQGASLLLGRPFRMTGPVVRGRQRGGGQLGFPTANLSPSEGLLPAVGVYAARVTLPFATMSAEEPGAPSEPIQRTYRAVVNLGLAPTFGELAHPSLEAHLLDYNDPSFYGHVIDVDFVDRIRDERRFEDIHALQAQIQRDVEASRHILETVDR